MSDYGDDGGGGAFAGMGGIQMMGIMNALKTGDVRLDMFIAMCIPIVLRMAFDFINNISSVWNWQGWMQWYFRRQNEYERFITYKVRSKKAWLSRCFVDTNCLIFNQSVCEMKLTHFASPYPIKQSQQEVIGEEPPVGTAILKTPC